MHAFFYEYGVQEALVSELHEGQISFIEMRTHGASLAFLHLQIKIKEPF